MQDRLIRVIKRVGDYALDLAFGLFCLRKRTYSDDVYIFLAINGAGLGHLTRALGIAKALKRKRPDSKIIFLTTSIGVPLVVRQGFTCFHVPPFALAGDVGSREWNGLFFSQLSSLISLYRPSKVVFDGTAPYEGLLRAMRRFPAIKYVWIKRGLYKSAALDEKLKKHVKRFSSVIIPGEVGDETSAPNENVVFVPPIVMCGSDEVLPAEIAIERLGLLPSKKRVLIQLGAGNINDISGQLGQVVSFFNDRSDVEVCVAHSPISLNQLFLPNVKNIEVYPMSWYFSAFDLVVCAAGYNSVCEIVYHKVPAILIPNVSTKSDDQVTRAKMAALFGTLALNEPLDRSEFLNCVSQLFDGQNNNTASRTECRMVNGADNASHVILNI
ncbi:MULTISPECIES: glycosyltransferase [unclassified Pseudomonas]|uniref:glycosyltransferase n=1 Tax=unclassified Pseudomonas TaxID=196821 RepID=UPI0012DE7ADB|nr:glycosyltransferase [Pseudomonas sp. FGI182]